MINKMCYATLNCLYQRSLKSQDSRNGSKGPGSRSRGNARSVLAIAGTAAVLTNCSGDESTPTPSIASNFSSGNSIATSHSTCYSTAQISATHHHGNYGKFIESGNYYFPRCNMIIFRTR